ncbi:MAG: glycosyltransferase family 39 protein [Kofleriaceae bacterium]
MSQAAAAPSPWRRPWGPAALAALALFAALAWGWRRSDELCDDWQGWRQADTQAMARSQAFESFDPLRPRIDWRGDGPGYVEAELPIYPALVALPLRALGDRAWPGQLLSLACVLLACALLFAHLARRFGGLAGAVALVAVLTGQGMIVASTSIQPDPLALLAFTVGWLAFARYLEAPGRAALVTWVLATLLAGLVKPTTLELGLAQALLCALAHRRALRDPRVWLGWAIIVVSVAAYLWHARGLYLTYGNTFGVLSGGDSKLPALARLAEPASWRELARYAVVWGVTWPGALAALVLLARRRVGAEAAALAVAAFALCVLAFRYTSGPFGTHYHLPHAVLGAYLVARAVALVLAPASASGREARADDAATDATDAAAVVGGTASASRASAALPLLRRALLAALVLASLAQAARAARFLRRLPPQPETALGHALATLASPGTLVAVRARAERYNTDWRTPNNFEDPRVFYLSRTYGWVLPNDLRGAEAIARLRELVARGARYYVHVNQGEPDAELRAFLAADAERVASLPVGDIYALRGGAARSQPAR